MDFIPWHVTFFISLFVGLEYGVMCGFLISLIFLIYYAAKPEIAVERGEVI
jgi:MFS superfamily sulfate permease-like transporter